MLFRTNTADATWDTWMYYDRGVYYLYYLITEHSPGESFGVAVSTDGVHWEDRGPQLWASSRMVEYLGTGAVWPLGGSAFACNYSEWRESPEGISQNIYFARSSDLVHWEKLGDASVFSPDARYYRTWLADGARWDCIYPLKKEDCPGFWGVWTATPKAGRGIGLGESEDGLRWQALPPPDIDLTPFGECAVEAGAITRHGGRYYLMIGSYAHPDAMGIFAADRVEGPYAPQRESFSLFSNRETMHAYFARFLETPEGTLVNFHVLLRERNGHDRPYTYFSPLKLVDYDEAGTLRLKWWPANDALLGEPLGAPAGTMACEATVQSGEALDFLLVDGSRRRLVVDQRGRAEMRDPERVLEIADRAVELGPTFSLRVLMRGTLVEVYAEDWFLLCYTLPSTVERMELGGADPKYRALLVDAEEEG